MMRVAIEEIVLFLVPFAGFLLVLVLARRNVLDWTHWSPHVVWLATAGLVIVIGSFVLTGVFSERHTGAYEPPHMENGKVVPGHFR